VKPKPEIGGHGNQPDMARPKMNVRNLAPMSTRDLPGVSAMSLYVPPFRVDLKDWCSWTDNSWEKISAVVGRSFRVCGRHENVYTMAANAVLR